MSNVNLAKNNDATPGIQKSDVVRAFDQCNSRPWV